MKVRKAVRRLPQGFWATASVAIVAALSVFCISAAMGSPEESAEEARRHGFVVIDTTDSVHQSGSFSYGVRVEMGSCTAHFYEGRLLGSNQVRIDRPVGAAFRREIVKDPTPDTTAPVAAWLGC